MGAFWSALPSLALGVLGLGGVASQAKARREQEQEDALNLQNERDLRILRGGLRTSGTSWWRA